MTEFLVYLNDIELTSISAVLATADGPGHCEGAKLDDTLSAVSVVCDSLGIGFFVAVDGAVGTTGRLGPLKDPDQRACVPWKIVSPPNAADVASVDSQTGAVTYSVSIPAFTASWKAPVTAVFTWAGTNAPAGTGVTSTTATTTATVTSKSKFFAGLNVVYLDPVNGCPSTPQAVLTGTCTAAWNPGSLLSGISVTLSSVDMSSMTATYTVSNIAAFASYPVPVTLVIRWGSSATDVVLQYVVPRTGSATATTFSRQGPGFLLFPGLTLQARVYDSCDSTQNVRSPGSLTLSRLDLPEKTSLLLDGSLPAGLGVSPSNGGTVTTWADRAGSTSFTCSGTAVYNDNPNGGHGFVSLRNNGVCYRLGLSSGSPVFSSSPAHEGEFSVVMVFKKISTPGSATSQRVFSMAANSVADVSSTNPGFSFESGGSGTSYVRYKNLVGIRSSSPCTAGWACMADSSDTMNQKAHTSHHLAVATMSARGAMGFTWDSTTHVNSIGAPYGGMGISRICLGVGADATGTSTSCTTSISLYLELDIHAFVVYRRVLSISELEEVKAWARARFHVPDVAPNCRLIGSAAKRYDCLNLFAPLLVPPPTPDGLAIDVSAYDTSGTGKLNWNSQLIYSLANLVPGAPPNTVFDCSTTPQVNRFAMYGEFYIEFSAGVYCAAGLSSSAPFFTSTTGAMTLIALMRDTVDVGLGATAKLFAMGVSGTADTAPGGFSLRRTSGATTNHALADNQVTAGSLQDKLSSLVSDPMKLFVHRRSKDGVSTAFWVQRALQWTGSAGVNTLAPTKLILNSGWTGTAVQSSSAAALHLGALQVYDHALTDSEVEVAVGLLHARTGHQSLLPNCTRIDGRFAVWCANRQADLSGLGIPVEDSLVVHLSADDTDGTGSPAADSSPLTGWVNLATHPQAAGTFTCTNGPAIRSGFLKGRHAVQFVNGAGTTSDYCQGSFAGSTFTPAEGMTVAVVWKHTEDAWDVNNAQKVVAMSVPFGNEGANGFYLGAGNVGGTTGKSYQTGWCASSSCTHIFSNQNLIAPSTFSLTITTFNQNGLKTFHDGVYTSSGAGQSGLDPRIVCLGASMQGSAGCTVSNAVFTANMMVAKVMIWRRVMTDAEVEQVKVFVNSQYRLVGLAGGAINCDLLSGENRAWCDFWSFPPELARGLFFHLNADDFYGTGIRPVVGTAIPSGTTWKNLRDASFASSKGLAINLSHMTCTGAGIVYNVQDVGNPLFLNGRGYISLSATSKCTNVLPGGTATSAPSYFSEASNTESSSRSIFFLSRYHTTFNGGSNALPVLAVGPYGTGAPSASSNGVVFEKGCALWGTCTFSYKSTTNIIGSCSCGSGTSGTDNGAMTVSPIGFSLQSIRITKDSARIGVDSVVTADAHSVGNVPWWTKAIGLNCAPTGGTTFSTPGEPHHFAFVMMYDRTLSDPEFELLKLWVVSEYGIDLDVNCEIVSPRYRAICNQVLAGP